MTSFSRPFEPTSLWIVKWKDAVNHSCRAQLADLSTMDLAINVNVGWIIDENASRIILAHGYSDTGEIDYFAIPTNCIVEKFPVKGSSNKKGTKDVR